MPSPFLDHHFVSSWRHRRWQRRRQPAVTSPVHYVVTSLAHRHQQAVTSLAQRHQQTVTSVVSMVWERYAARIAGWSRVLAVTGTRGTSHDAAKHRNMQKCNCQNIVVNANIQPVLLIKTHSYDMYTYFNGKYNKVKSRYSYCMQWCARTFSWFGWTNVVSSAVYKEKKGSVESDISISS